MGDYDPDDEAGNISKEEFAQLHATHFPEYIAKAVEMNLLDKRLATLFDLAALAAALDVGRDDLYKYSGLSTMQNRYLMKDQNQAPLETPQYFWMRVAMGMSLNEEDPTEWAKRFYEKLSTLEYLSAGSTNLGAGTPHPKLSNCFLMEMHDDMEHIGKTISDVVAALKSCGRHRPLRHQAPRQRFPLEIFQHEIFRTDSLHAHHRFRSARPYSAAARSSERCASTWKTGTLIPGLHRPQAEQRR